MRWNSDAELGRKAALNMKSFHIDLIIESERITFHFISRFFCFFVTYEKKIKVEQFFHENVHPIIILTKRVWLSNGVAIYKVRKERQLE